jgi:peptide/nickel transport system permease protein
MREGAAEIPVAVAPALGVRRKRHWADGVKSFVRRKPLGAVGGGLLLGVVLVAIFAPFVATHDYLVHDIPNRLIGPGRDYFFGTDIFGRDQFSRIVYGARISIYVGLVSVGFGTLVGVTLGVASGYLGGKFDLVVQRFVDALLGFPSLVLVLVMVVALSPSLNSVTIAIAISFAPRVTRISRASTLSIRQEVYVLAAQAIGTSTGKIMLRHVFPNSLAPVFVLATGYLGTAIVVEASLSFLGLGVPPPQPSWGNMLQFAARGFHEVAPWLAIFPGLALASVSFAFALFGDALRDVLDPRLRGS